MFYIYGLRLEGDSEYRYVGSTKNPQQRMWGHLAGEDRNPAKDEWVTQNRERIVLDVLQEVEADHLGAERAMAVKLHNEGHRLFNVRQPRVSTQDEKRSQLARMLDKLDPDDGIIREPGPIYTA